MGFLDAFCDSDDDDGWSNDNKGEQRMEDKTVQNSEVVAAIETPAVTPPDPKISEEDRLRARVAYLETVVANNAMVALEAKHKLLNLEAQMVQLQFTEVEKESVAKKTALDTELRTVYTKYNVPDTWMVDTNTGLISPPAKK
jgi:hypothetical protein